MNATIEKQSTILPPETMARLERMELVTRKVFRGRMKGERRSKRKGQSVEFADFRAYVPGDDLRFIDWNLFARMDRLYIKLFLEEEDLHIYLIVDDSTSMNFGEPTKLRAAQQLAAALGYVGLCRGDRVSVQSFRQPKPLVVRGRSSVHRLVEAVESYSQFEPDLIPVKHTMQDAIKSFVSRSKSKGIVVVLSDLMEKQGYEPALRMLVARELDIFLVHVLSPEELQPTLTGDLKLVDSEDDDVREISVSAPLLQRYQATLNAFVAEAKSFCNRRGINYISARSDQSADYMVQHYLRARGLLR
jgi:uncharacterized protein (DUF58 family)